MTPEACPHCAHELTLGRCWRLSCPSNGAREAAEVTKPGERYLGAHDAAEAASEARGREIRRPAPPVPATMFELWKGMK